MVFHIVKSHKIKEVYGDNIRFSQIHIMRFQVYKKQETPYPNNWDMESVNHRIVGSSPS